MGGESVKKRTITGKKREQKLIDELQRGHMYMFIELSRKAERETMQFQRDKETGKSLCTPAVCIKLVVPADSALGERIVEMRKKKAKEGKKR
jgi:hypothetical protein